MLSSDMVGEVLDCAAASRSDISDMPVSAADGRIMDELGEWLGDDMNAYDDAMERLGEAVSEENGDILFFSSCHKDSK